MVLNGERHLSSQEDLAFPTIMALIPQAKDRVEWGGVSVNCLVYPFVLIQSGRYPEGSANLLGLQ